MCFSATASFTASAVLFGLGGIAMRAAPSPRERPLAAVPLLFAVQQAIEGVLWLTFNHDAPALNAFMTHLYVVFAHVLWPAYIPLAVLLIEPRGERRRALLAVVVIGAVVSAWLLIGLVRGGAVSRPLGAHVEYVTREPFVAVATALYVVATTAGLLLSSRRPVRVFGGLTIVAFAVTWLFYEAWLVSVWCYFAALLSVAVLWQITRLPAPALSDSARRVVPLG